MFPILNFGSIFGANSFMESPKTLPVRFSINSLNLHIYSAVLRVYLSIIDQNSGNLDGLYII